MQDTGTRVTAVRGDLTAQPVEAIVNAANEHLQHGGGVAAAIARAGGPSVQEESDRWVATQGPLHPGVAAVTSGGRLTARWIVHVAGPRYREGQDNEGLLRKAVAAALDAAAGAGARSVAFPAISAGIFGYPRDAATAVIASEVTAWCSAHPGALTEVRLVGYDAETVEDFTAGLQKA
jgi:putative ATPase